MQTSTIASPRLAEIGRHICAHADELVDEWVTISRKEQPQARGEQRDQLRNLLPEFLRNYGQTLSAGISRIPRRHALDHGIQRWEIGWDVDSLVCDFMILRRVLVARLHDAVNLKIQEAIEIGATLDEAVGVSINAYVTHRERDLNKVNEQLRQSNYELKRFAHVVAHEIRNPLSVVLMAGDRMRRICADAPNPELDHAIVTIEEGALTIREVINDLLKYAELEIESGEPQEQIDLNEVLKEALSCLPHAITNADADISAERLPTLKGHRRALVQLFQNIIENGIKYCGNKPPKIRIALVEKHDDRCVLSFRDDGVGIGEEDHERIFRFLARANHGHDVPGSGIGLSICRRVAEQHHGRIWVESAVGEGSTFYVTLHSGEAEAGA